MLMWKTRRPSALDGNATSVIEVGGRCTPVVVPANAYYSECSFGRSWECDPGFRQEGETCMAVRTPAHGFLVGERVEWACDRGFMKSADSGVPVASTREWLSG